jgi:hypothetical protein
LGQKAEITNQARQKLLNRPSQSTQSFKEKAQMKSAMRSLMKSKIFRLSAISLATAAALSGAATPAAADEDDVKFAMVRSPALAATPSCVPYARGKVTIEPEGPVERMRVDVEGLPSNTNFDFFVIQVPNAPFGMAWYQGDIETDSYGKGHARFLGRFNVETFIVAPGSVASPIVFNNAFPDVSPNPKTGPIHTYHLGLWFNSPHDAVKAGCAGNVTPFNGEHEAGVQVLNTSDFPDLQGPLIKVK